MHDAILISIVILCIIIIVFSDTDLFRCAAFFVALFLTYDRFIGWNSLNDDDNYYKSKPIKTGGNINETNDNIGKWLNIDIDKIKQKLNEMNAKKIHEEKKYELCIYMNKDGYLKMKKEYNDENEEIILLNVATNSTFDKNNIEITGNYKDFSELIIKLGFKQIFHMEMVCEKYDPNNSDINEIEICHIPGFQPMLKIYGENEENIYKYAKKLNLDEEDVRFKSDIELYKDIYGIENVDKISELKFGSAYKNLRQKVNKRRKQFVESCKMFKHL